MAKAKSTFTIDNENAKPFPVTLSGRLLWALSSLMAKGGTGCTPISEPAPRWSAYIFDLRAMGVQIETKHEPHAGPYPGTHGRYVLKSQVTQVFEVAA